MGSIALSTTSEFFSKYHFLSKRPERAIILRTRRLLERASTNAVNDCLPAVIALDSRLPPVSGYFTVKCARPCSNFLIRRKGDVTRHEFEVSSADIVDCKDAI